MDYRENIEDSAPFLGVTLSIVFVRRFPEEASKLSANFLTVSEISGSSIPSNILVVIRSCIRVADHLTACLKAFLWTLARPLFNIFLGGSLKFL